VYGTPICCDELSERWKQSFGTTRTDSPLSLDYFCYSGLAAPLAECLRRSV
jgi:hypothetical protein